jgi:Ni,Fe-hydrogenase III large subunit
MTGLVAEGLLIKERIWKALGALCGNRLMHGLIGVGGLRRQPGQAELEAAMVVVRQALADLERFSEKYFGSSSNLERLTGTGVLAREHAVKLGAVGPVARASGVETDSRLALAGGEIEQKAYHGLEMRTLTGGDVLARAQQRLIEARDSVRLCELMQGLAAGAPRAKAGAPSSDHGEGFGWAEAARGEIVTYARVEKGRLARLRVRSPSRMNWPAITLAIPGNIVPDFPLINKSFNLSYAGCDL